MGHVSADRAELIAHYAFPLDQFQLDALDALDRGESVLVAAPTGSGKTVVAEYAIDAVVAGGKRAFYTAPIKALSNQKYHDLVARLGPHRVGLLTGDNSINPDADVVVMTTEVLRNMIYGHSPGLRNLAVVVLDEVHFLQDTYRGPVWEEVIIHLPPNVRLVCLSATVSNATELAEWISTVRGVTSAVVEDRRPVQARQPLPHRRQDPRPSPPPAHSRERTPKPEAARLDEEAALGTRGDRKGGKQRPSASVHPFAIGSGRSPRTTGNAAGDLLHLQPQPVRRGSEGVGWLPALRLTTGADRERVREIVDARLGAIDPADLAVLGYSQFLAQLEAGVAAHHAGMVPPFKEVVESCFVEGLVKVVFATETLAVGINMPAKTVVIEKLSKFTGDHHQFLTPGEYTQLTGRAGRRGIDELGHAVVLWSPFVPFDQVAALASSRSFHLNSAFRPTYNMAANLVRSYTSERAHHLLNLSFAQYQADREVVKLEARLERRQRHVADLREKALSPYGDIDEYRRLIATVEPLRPAPYGRDDPVTLAMLKVRPGDVLYVEKGRYAGRVAVLTTAHRKGAIRVTALTTRRDLLTLSTADFVEPPKPIGRVTLPTEYTPSRNDYQREVVARLENAEVTPHSRRRRVIPAADGTGSADEAHPVELDPDIGARLKVAAQADRAEAEVDELNQKMRGRRQSIALDFDRVLKMLDRWGYVDGWALTDAGIILARLFHESDLLVAECLRKGLLDGLDPASLAGLVSVFVYEHRSPEAPPAPWYPSPLVRRRWQSIARISYELQDAEEQAGLSVHRPPDPTFVAVAFAWAAGEGFAEVVEAEELSGGDFVRTMKQLIDLLRQLALVAPSQETRLAAQKASDALFRGVVAASTAVEAEAGKAPEEALGDDPQG